jgi:hypothetical protein
MYCSVLHKTLKQGKKILASERKLLIPRKEQSHEIPRKLAKARFAT